MNQRNFITVTWTLFVAVVLIGFVAWGQGIGWNFNGFNSYQLFPLLGILAWLIMWTHYVIGSIRIKNPELQKAALYSKVSSYIVLASLILHPGILAFEQFVNGQGLPPASYTAYAGQSMRLAVFLGMIGVTLFLAYEVLERFKKNSTLQKYWWVVSLSQSFAMTLIFVHALRLGGSLGQEWFRIIWIVMGVALLPCFYIIHTSDFQSFKTAKS